MSKRLYLVIFGVLLVVVLFHTPRAWTAQPTNVNELSINAGLAGSWANAAIPGQGIFVDVDPASRVVFLAWFTYGTVPPLAESVIGWPSNRWFVAVGNYEEGAGEVTLSLIETEGGVFDKAVPVTEMEVGTLSLRFTSCTEAVMVWTFDDSGPQGSLNMSRLTPADVCESLNAR